MKRGLISLVFFLPGFFSYVFLRWLKDKNYKYLLFLLPIQILWANMHGSFMLGPGLLGVFACFLAVERFFRFSPADKEQTLTLRQISVLPLFAFLLLGVSLLNPFGFIMLQKSFFMFFTHSYLTESVNEWHRFSEVRWGLWAYLWMFWQISGWAFLFYNRKNSRTHEWLLMALSLYFPFSGIRYVSLSAIISLPVLYKHLPRAGFSRINYFTIGALIICNIWIGFKGYPQTPLHYRDSGLGFDTKKIPLAVFAHLKAHQYKGNLLNHYNDGATVIYFSGRISLLT